MNGRAFTLGELQRQEKEKMGVRKKDKEDNKLTELLKKMKQGNSINTQDMIELMGKVNAARTEEEAKNIITKFFKGVREGKIKPHE